MSRRYLLVLVCIVVLISTLSLSWFYGNGISEKTAYRIADEYAQTYALRNDINLNLFTPPSIGGQAGNRLFEFSWKSKQGGKPLTIAVDAINIDVSVIESPLQELTR